MRNTRGGRKAQGRYGGGWGADTVRSTNLFSLPPKISTVLMLVDRGISGSAQGLSWCSTATLYPAPSGQGRILSGRHTRKPRISSPGGVNCLDSLHQSRKIKPPHQSRTHPTWVFSLIHFSDKHLLSTCCMFGAGEDRNVYETPSSHRRIRNVKQENVK